MPTNFILRLDTTAPADPAIVINGGTAVADPNVTVSPSTSDPDTTGYQVKLWGDVDPSFHFAIQPLEGDAGWVNWSSNIAVKLSAGNGGKVVYARFRDDVGNETVTVQDSIVFDTTIPTVDIVVPADRVKISKIATFDTSIFSFASDSDFTAWTVRVVTDVDATHVQGTEIPPTAGSLNTAGATLVTALTPVQVTVKGTDLEAASAGDGDKLVKVFVREQGSGAWSV